MMPFPTGRGAINPALPPQPRPAGDDWQCMSTTRRIPVSAQFSAASTVTSRFGGGNIAPGGWQSNIKTAKLISRGDFSLKINVSLKLPLEALALQ